ncbi:MAG TPA: ATP-binding cassette domain-containing protein [Acidimicrobiales bacterium]|jgi:iron complex transport system ATP-binding protein|nr:ATP-binding cassette domain-containing protein [Acidimicrobiales bacterium]
MSHPALELRGVSVHRDGQALLDQIDWVVAPQERWVVLGPNGSGKTTLLRVASLYLHPSRGTVAVDGEELGHTDVRRLRTRVGLASPAFGDLLRRELTAREVVMTARYAALEPWWHTYGSADRAHAAERLERFGVGPLADRMVGTLSSGERQRVLLARAFAGRPALVLLDEPTAGLDLGGREDLVRRLTDVGRDPHGPPTVLVTHHVEEIPSSTTHILLLRSGRVLAAGPIGDVLTAGALSEAFGLPLELERRHDRWGAWARG